MFYTISMVSLPKDWSKDGETLCLTFTCTDFKHAIRTVASIAEIAERLNHHPDLGVRNYNEVFIRTTTHSVGKLTEKDYQLANEINKLLGHTQVSS